MKKILATLLSFLLVAPAFADTCAKGLTNVFNSYQAVKLCATFVGTGTVSASLIPGADNSYDLGSTTYSFRSLYTATSRITKTSDILRVRQDAQRLFTWDGSSDTALTMTFGDGGTTAVQQLLISASTADADDDSSLILAGGGADGGTRGSSITLQGEEVAGGGDIVLNTGASDTVTFNINGSTAAYIDGGGVATSGAGKDFISQTAATGFVAGESARAANVTTATTLAVPLYLSAAASGTDLGAFIGSGVSASGPVVDFFKTRAVTGAATTIVNSADAAGTLKFFGANGTTYDPAAQIVVKIDGTPGASADMPGSIDFQTSPDGSATPASVLKLDSAKLATFTGAIKSTATTIGWVVRTGANTACTTTCGAGKGCVGGYDIGTTALVDCAAATADSCFCTF